MVAALSALLLMASTVLVLFGWALAANPTVYFMAVNEVVLDLNAETMPVVVRGVMYVPYTMFDSYSSGISLGVFASYNKDKNTAMVYNRSRALIFDLAENTSYDKDSSYSYKALIRNSTVYLPVKAVCDYFTELNYSLIPLDYGYIVRVKSDSAVLTDGDFAPAAEYRARPMYNAYVRGLSPSPSPSESGTPDPGGTSEPAPTPSGTDQPEGSTVYLAFRCIDGEGLDAIQSALARYQVYGLFFFYPEALADQDDRIRALAADGHRIGLLLDRAAPDELQAQAALGNELLRHILRSGSRTVLLEDGGAQAGEGLFVWNTTVDGTPGARSAVRQSLDIIRAAERDDPSFVLLDDSAQSATALSRVLDTLTGESCQFRLAVETVLAQASG